MIVSNDSIMKPPYDLNNNILKSLTAISEKIGEVKAAHLHKPSPELRKRNRIKTIKASLEIEGNTLSEEQITAIIENKRVLGPKKDIIEVVNAIAVYDALPDFKAHSLKSFLKAHKMLMKDLVEKPGKLRTSAVGIFKGNKISHLAPPAGNLDFLMNNLFDYIKKEDDHVLIKSCVAHYEIEFIHPFVDGNGRMGRLWQTLILMKAYPVFEYLPFETVIKNRQDEYYEVLEASDKAGKSTQFIEYMLAAINESLEELLKIQNRQMTMADRVAYFLSVYRGKTFTRKDYTNIFKEISTSTASRDLKYAVSEKLVRKQGDKRATTYKIK